MSTKVSVRQTQRGDWLVFEAREAHNGTGMVTGVQYGRKPECGEALAMARQVALECNGEVVDFVFCDPNPPGELRHIPWNSSMYSHLRRDELPNDEYGRPITGYMRYLVDGTRIEPKRRWIVEAQFEQQYFDETVWDTRYFIDLVDDVMYTVRQKSSCEGSKILYHADNLPDALGYLRWLTEQKSDWAWRLEWRN